MESLFHFWWLIFPLGAMVGGGVRAVAAANERRAERRLERYRIKQQTKSRSPRPPAGRSTNEMQFRRRELRKVLDQHDETDARWLDYEIDVAKLLDFPLMTDMRNPLTMDFHKARRRADLLRPENVDDLVGDREAQLEYRDAVHDYVTAFDVAEAEAIRLRRSSFSDEDQQRIARAQNLLRLAEDDAATPQERQSAYARAQLELDRHPGAARRHPGQHRAQDRRRDRGVASQAAPASATSPARTSSRSTPHSSATRVTSSPPSSWSPQF